MGWSPCCVYWRTSRTAVISLLSSFSLSLCHPLSLSLTVYLSRCLSLSVSMPLCLSVSVLSLCHPPPASASLISVTPSLSFSSLSLSYFWHSLSLSYFWHSLSVFLSAFYLFLQASLSLSLARSLACSLALSYVSFSLYLIHSLSFSPPLYLSVCCVLCVIPSVFRVPGLYRW